MADVEGCSSTSIPPCGGDNVGRERGCYPFGGGTTIDVCSSTEESRSSIYNEGHRLARDPGLVRELSQRAGPDTLPVSFLEEGTILTMPMVSHDLQRGWRGRGRGDVT